MTGHIAEVVKLVENSPNILNGDLRPEYTEKFGQLAQKYTDLEKQIKDSK